MSLATVHRAAARPSRLSWSQTPAFAGAGSSWCRKPRSSLQRRGRSRAARLGPALPAAKALQVRPALRHGRGGGWGDRQYLADRPIYSKEPPVGSTMIIDEGAHLFNGRSTGPMHASVHGTRRLRLRKIRRCLAQDLFGRGMSSRSWPLSTRPLPNATQARLRDPAPTAPLGGALRVKTCSSSCS